MFNDPGCSSLVSILFEIFRKHAKLYDVKV